MALVPWSEDCPDTFIDDMETFIRRTHTWLLCRSRDPLEKVVEEYRNRNSVE